MPFDLTIEPSEKGKGRVFRATGVAYMTADALWSGGDAAVDTVRPVWAVLAGTDTELRPFVANLQIGKKALHRTGCKTVTRYEFLRSADYTYTWQRFAEGSVCTIFLHDLFRHDLGMVDPKAARFCVLPDRNWIPAADPKAVEHLKLLGVATEEEKVMMSIAMAPLFIGYLERRTRCPIVADIRFYAQVLYYALEVGLASWGSEYRYGNSGWGRHQKFGFSEQGVADAGYAPGLVFQGSHVTIETFLAQQVSLYFSKVGT